MIGKTPALEPVEAQTYLEMELLTQFRLLPHKQQLLLLAVCIEAVKLLKGKA